MKPFIAVAGLQKRLSHHLQLYLIQVIGFYQILLNVSEIGRVGHGYTDLNKAIAESSDTYFYQLAYNMGIDRLSGWMQKFGFGLSTGIDIQEETNGIMPSRVETKTP